MFCGTFDMLISQMTMIFLETIKEQIRKFYYDYEQTIHRFLSDCLTIWLSNDMMSSNCKFPTNLHNYLNDKNEDYRVITLNSLNNKEITFYQFYRCYYYESQLMIGVSWGNMNINNIYQVTSETFVDITKNKIREFRKWSTNFL